MASHVVPQPWNGGQARFKALSFALVVGAASLRWPERVPGEGL